MFLVSSRLHKYSILAHVPVPVSHLILVPISYIISDIHCGPHMFFKKIMYPRTRTRIGYDTVSVSVQLRVSLGSSYFVMRLYLFLESYFCDFSIYCELKFGHKLEYYKIYFNIVDWSDLLRGFSLYIGGFST
jgi:hypothetical protein